MARAGPGPAPAGERWEALDAVRGAAMAFVCVSHFGTTFFPHALRAGDPRGAWLEAIGRVATPSFMILSGAVLGYLVDRAGGVTPALRQRLRWRGLLLLFAARPAIMLANVPFAGSLDAVLRLVFVTDAIGFSMLAAPPLVARVGARGRLAAGAAAVALGWVAAGWSAPAGWPAVVKELLLGAQEPVTLRYVFPLVPWLGVYLAATVLGEALGRLRREGRGRAAVVVLVAGAASVGLGVAGALAHHALRDAATLRTHPALATLGASWQKVPPGPVYIALYGGMGLLLLAAFLALEARGLAPGLRRGAALVGRHSLGAFVAQYFVFQTGIVLLAPRRGAAWPLWLAGTTALVGGVALALDRLAPRRRPRGAPGSASSAAPVHFAP